MCQVPVCTYSDDNKTEVCNQTVLFSSRNATNHLDKLVKELDKEVRMGGGHFHQDMIKQRSFHSKRLWFPPRFQMSSRQKVEASLRQLERERALLQHQSSENLRKVEIETDRKRGLENECEHLGHNATINSLKLHLVVKIICFFLTGSTKCVRANTELTVNCLYLHTSEQPEGPAGGS